MEYSVPSIGREFGSVFLGDKNVAQLVVSEGWAKVLLLTYMFLNLFVFGAISKFWLCRSESKVSVEEK